MQSASVPARDAPAPITPPPRLLLFDLDDTLCDYASARVGRLRRAFSLDLVAGDEASHRVGDGPGGTPLGRDVDRMIADSLAIHPHGADHFPELFRRHGIADAAVAEAAMTWYRTNRFEGLALFADAVATLETLRHALPDGRIGLITNGPADVQRPKVELLGVERLVDFILISGEFGAWKPDPAIFAEALRLGDAAATEAVFVGDSAEHDIAGAQATGIRAVWVNRTGRPWAAPTPPPDHEIPHLTALLPLLGVGA